MIIHGVRAYHLILNICSRCAPFNDESLWDLFQHDLEGLVKKLSILSDCGTRNIATLLFLVACKYRDVAGRRRVIDLLRYDANGSEGAFLADVAERIVYAEEGGLAHPVTCEDIPANVRVRPHSSMAGRDERKQAVSAFLLKVVFSSNHCARRYSSAQSIFISSSDGCPPTRTP